MARDTNGLFVRPALAPPTHKGDNLFTNSVFTGELTGEFIAFDSDTGKILWQFQTPSGIIGQPITWEHNGKQYVTITGGIGGVYVLRTPDPNLAHVPPGGTLWTFALFDQ